MVEGEAEISVKKVGKKEDGTPQKEKCQTSRLDGAERTARDDA